MRIQSITLIVASLLSFSAFAASPKGQHFDRVITVIFENTDYSEAIQQPFLSQLAKGGALFSNFMALTHPSQGNYIALTSGDLNGVSGDAKYDVDVNNIVDLLEAKGLTWKVYAEDYPGNCFKSSKGNYVRKHNPFISYVNIQSNPERCANIVNASQFDSDAAAGNLPNYVFYVPNIKNDGHDTGVSFADTWYSNKFGAYVADPKFMAGTILISTFDESGGGFGANQIYTSIVGSTVKPGDYSTEYSIPSLLRMIEDNWGLGDLGKQDTTATQIVDIWN